MKNLSSSHYWGILFAFVLFIGISFEFRSPLWLAALILIITLILWLVVIRRASKIYGTGIYTLILTLASICSLENALRAVPANYLAPEIFKVPPLAPINRGNEIIRKNGFRGKNPCTTCPEETVRIITMGGSSTFGVPMINPQDTYSEKLQGILNERRRDKKFEVLNAGIAGYGLSQILETIEVELVKLKPDIIMVCAWFNDSSPIPNWWGIPNKSDWETYKMIRFLRFVESIPGYSTLHSSRLFGISRYFLTRLRDRAISAAPIKLNQKKRGKQRVARMSPEEFRQGLERLVGLGERHNFLPVIVFEPLHRTRPLTPGIRGYKYYSVMQEVARKYDLPLINTLNEFSKRSDQRIFYDFIHPNKEGHTLMSEIIYDELFFNVKSRNKDHFWNKLGIRNDEVKPRRAFFHTIDTPSRDFKVLTFKARAVISAKKEDFTLITILNNRKRHLTPLLTEEWQTYKVPLIDDDYVEPLISVSLKQSLTNTRGDNPNNWNDDLQLGGLFEVSDLRYE